MNIDEFVSTDKQAIYLDDIISFERQYDLTIPEVYKYFLLSPRKIEVLAFLRHPLNHEWQLIVDPEIGTMDWIKNGMIRRQLYYGEEIRLENQEMLLEIGGTHDGPSIYLGHTEPIIGKVFINDNEELTENNEEPVYLVANSFAEFLKKLEPMTAD